MATNTEILKQARESIKANKAAAISTRTAEILNTEVLPKVNENTRKFNEAVAAAKAELEKDNQALREAGIARANAEVEAEYAVMFDGLAKLIGE